jgi:hypothetical protein
MSSIWKPHEGIKVSVNAANQSIVFIHFSGDIVLRGDDVINAVWQALPANFEQILERFKEEFEGTDLELEESVQESIALLQQHHLITEELC